MKDQLSEYIEGLERQLQTPKTRLSEKELTDLLSVDFIEYGSSGNIYSRDDIIDALAGEVDVNYTMWGFEMIQLSESLIQARYYTRTTEGGLLRNYALRSSVWKNENGVWRMTFHQGTPMSENQIKALKKD